MAGDDPGFGPIIAALATMQSNVQGKEKAEAHQFLEKFQKSPDAWTVTGTILQDSSITVEARLFAATTLKGKVRIHKWCCSTAG
jgi:transportin-3